MEKCKCFCCGGNMTCFVSRLKHHLLEYNRVRQVRSKTDFYYMRHFAPLTWYCNFGSTLNATHIIRFDTKKRIQLAKTFNKVLQTAGVPISERNYIRREMLKRLPAHATSTSEEREIVRDVLFSNKKTLEIFAVIYYYDFVVFGYHLPISHMEKGPLFRD
ncbi:hypothetical protein V3C99_011935 [Haemonchus contortus]